MTLISGVYRFIFGPGLARTDNADGTVTIDVTGAPPTGSAGGVLDGTYPNPGLAAAVAGAGLAETSNVLSVNVDGSTIEIATDTLQVKAGGIGATQLASTAVTPATYGDGTHGAVQFTVDADGRITSATSLPISGSGGGGSFVATDPIWDASGDLVQGTGADTAARLAIGAEGTRLFSNGTTSSWNVGGSVLLYDYTVSGSDKASINTGADTPQAGISGTSAFSGAYRILEFWLYARTDEAVAKSVVNILLNNDSGSNYDNQRLTGDNATAAAGAGAAGAVLQVFAPGASAAASYFGGGRAAVPNYAGTVGFKQVEFVGGMNDNTATNMHAAVRIWTYRSTSALTRISVAPATAAKKLVVGSRLMVFAR